MRLTIILCALLFAGCERPANQNLDASPDDGQASEIGRWTIIYSPHVQRSTMLIDTETGDTWVLVSLGDGENAGFGWEFVGKLDQPYEQYPPATNSN